MLVSFVVFVKFCDPQVSEDGGGVGAGDQLVDPLSHRVIETFQKLSSYHILMPWIFRMRLRVFVNASESGTKLSHTSSLSAYYCVCLP